MHCVWTRRIHTACGSQQGTMRSAELHSRVRGETRCNSKTCVLVLKTKNSILEESQNDVCLCTWQKVLREKDTLDECRSWKRTAKQIHCWCVKKQCCLWTQTANHFSFQSTEHQNHLRILLLGMFDASRFKAALSDIQPRLILTLCADSLNLHNEENNWRNTGSDFASIMHCKQHVCEELTVLLPLCVPGPQLSFNFI